MSFIIIPVFYADFLIVRKTHYINFIEIFKILSYCIMEDDYWKKSDVLNTIYVDYCFNLF